MLVLSRKLGERIVVPQCGLAGVRPRNYVGSDEPLG